MGTNVLNLIIPSDDEMLEDLENIDNLALMKLQNERHIKLYGLWSATTVATKVIEQLVHSVQEKCRLEHSNKASINFNGVVECRLSTRRIEDAEKEGNLVVTFLIPEPIEFIEHEEQAQLLIPKDPEIRADMEKIDKEARVEIGSVNGLIFGHEWVVTTVTTVVLDLLIKAVHQKLLSSGGNFTCINLNDALECGARLREKGDDSDETEVAITLKPGVACRLAGKSDSITEYDED